MSKYSDLINVEDFGAKRENFNPDRGGIAYYCKNCKKIVETTRKSEKKLEFICNICDSEEIVIGTHEGLTENYKRKL